MDLWFELAITHSAVIAGFCWGKQDCPCSPPAPHKDGTDCLEGQEMQHVWAAHVWDTDTAERDFREPEAGCASCNAWQPWKKQFCRASSFFWLITTTTPKHILLILGRRGGPPKVHWNDLQDPLLYHVCGVTFLQVLKLKKLRCNSSYIRLSNFQTFFQKDWQDTYWVLSLLSGQTFTFFFFFKLWKIYLSVYFPVCRKLSIWITCLNYCVNAARDMLE